MSKGQRPDQYVDDIMKGPYEARGRQLQRPVFVAVVEVLHPILVSQSILNPSRYLYVFGVQSKICGFLVYEPLCMRFLKVNQICLFRSTLAQRPCQFMSSRDEISNLTYFSLCLTDLIHDIQLICTVNYYFVVLFLVQFTEVTSSEIRN